MIITLTDENLEFLKMLARKRNRKEKELGACTYGDKLDGVIAHFIGLAGEFAVAVSRNTVVDERIFETHGDDGIDLRENGEWGVKTTSYLRDPYLRVEIHHFNGELDGYVCCAYDPYAVPREDRGLRKVRIVGWATPGEVKTARKAVLKQGGPNNYILTEHQLMEWKENKSC